MTRKTNTKVLFEPFLSITGDVATQEPYFARRFFLALFLYYRK